MEIGQVLTLLPLEDDDPEDDESPEEPFTQQQFTIVGMVASGTYVSMVQRGSTTLGNGTVSCIAYVQDDVIDTDYYTDIYAVVEGGHKAEAFTQAYEDLVSPRPAGSGRYGRKSEARPRRPAAFRRAGGAGRSQAGAG